MSQMMLPGSTKVGRRYLHETAEWTIKNYQPRHAKPDPVGVRPPAPIVGVAPVPHTFRPPIVRTFRGKALRPIARRILGGAR